jgi:hypothetical protein
MGYSQVSTPPGLKDNKNVCEILIPKIKIIFFFCKYCSILNTLLSKHCLKRPKRKFISKFSLHRPPPHGKKIVRAPTIGRAFRTSLVGNLQILIKFNILFVHICIVVLAM